ncbi:MAG: hypothetical protein OEZ06_21805 [Myxococcales bacterium]|nr:hypothetical protein [Myxococcales bacterium]
MKRVFGLLVLGALLVWLMATLDVGRRRSGGKSGDGDGGEGELAATESGPAAVPRPGRSGAAETSASTRPAPGTVGRGELDPRPMQRPGKRSTSIGDERGDRQLPSPLAGSKEEREPPPPEGPPATGELGEGARSEHFIESETLYASEPRDKAFAHEPERKLRQALIEDGLGPAIIVLNCRSSICRLMLELQGQEPLERVLGVPGLAQLTGIQKDDPYSYREGYFVVYFRPESETPESGSVSK